ncbi:MAG: glycosyltransferase 87 family protein [Chloroflexota bacterium]|nr:glycosyltransferase 87 family protein [Chloroflexota bacterium]
MSEAPRFRRVAVASAAVVLFVGGSALLLADIGRHDFLAFYAAARLVAQGQGASIVDPAAILATEQAAEPRVVTVLPWVHPPAVALLLAPLGALPFAFAGMAMVALDVACLVWAIYRMRTLAAPAQRVSLFAIALTAPPAISSLQQGQTTPIVLALIAAAIATPSQFRGGLALGLTVIRPQTALLFALAGLTSRRTAVGVAVGWAVVLAGSAAVVGPAGLLTYLNQLVAASGWSISGEFGMRYAVGWTGTTFALGVPLLGFALAIGSLAAGAVAVARAQGRARILNASAWCILGSPHVGVSDALACYPAVAERSARSMVAAFVLVGTGYAVMALQLAGVPAAPFWMLGLALWPQRRVEPPPS